MALLRQEHCGREEPHAEHFPSERIAAERDLDRAIGAQRRGGSREAVMVAAVRLARWLRRG